MDPRGLEPAIVQGDWPSLSGTPYWTTLEPLSVANEGIDAIASSLLIATKAGECCESDRYRIDTLSARMTNRSDVYCLIDLQHLIQSTGVFLTVPLGLR